MPFESKGIDWDSAQRAFVERPQKPSYDELAIEFGCAAGSLARLSSENGWPALRARYMESQLTKSDASGVLLAAVKGDRTVTTSYLSLAIVTLSTLQTIVEEVRDSDRAAATKSDTINNCTFAAKNMAEALKTVGIVGIAKLLDNGKEDNGRWNPGMLNQINIQLTGLAQATEKAKAEVEASVKPAETPEQKP